jgi:hypothetical protein
MSELGDQARRLHTEALQADPRANRAWPGGPVGDALWAIATRLNVINREQTFQGTSLLLMDPRDLAVMGERLANAAQLEGMLVTAESLGAVAVALWVTSLRAAELDVSSGDEAA